MASLSSASGINPANFSPVPSMTRRVGAQETGSDLSFAKILSAFEINSIASVAFTRVLV
jgi:hypothetical protein